MASRWFTRNRSSPQEPAVTAARDGAVAAFLDLDTRQRFVTEAIDALQALEPRSRLIGEWKKVEHTCFDASAEYVNTSTRWENSTDTFGASSAYQHTHRVLAEAATAVDAFYRRHGTELDRARSAIAATPRIAQDAVNEASSARAALAADPQLAQFRSVQAARSELESAIGELDSALATNSAHDVRESANRIHALGQEVQKVLDAARGAEGRANNATVSVRTRIDAVQSRIERLPDARSALLREFSEPNSVDLVGNLALATRELDQGRHDWQSAKDALSTKRAEDALELLNSSREHLTTATTACDAVTDRLTALREVRTDPSGPERQTRFKIRDAQRLVVDRDLTSEWGSVLDAQSRRVDVALEKLSGTHPNYWAYLSELTSVQSFVKGVVERIREQAESAAQRRR